MRVGQGAQLFTAGKWSLGQTLAVWLSGLEGATQGFLFAAPNLLYPASSSIPYSRVPSLGGKASSFASYGRQVIPRNRNPSIEPSKRAANFLLHMTDIARRVCVTIGRDPIVNDDGVRHP